MNRMIKRGIIYETLMFLYATVITWIVFGSPFRALALTVFITITKYPIYCLFHHHYKEKK